MLQSEALSILKTGGNIFLTGEPGSGKTYVLNEYIEWLEEKGISVAVTASTGIAATHIGGMTIHAWSGIGARDSLSAYDLDSITAKERTVKRINKAKVLVIDEISMLDGRGLDMVETVVKAVRGNDDPFGGLQVVLVGDFFQLPPVAMRGETARFAFESRAWDGARFMTCYLKEQYRHEDDLLSELLASIRNNDIVDEHYELLKEQDEIGFPNIEPTKLFTHNKDVDEINREKLGELSGDKRVFTMTTRGSKILVEVLKKNCLSPESLELKIDAMVMCTKNNFEVGYVNGTLGRIIGYEGENGHPIIETSDGRELVITPHLWSVEEDGKILAELHQVPLRLAWAITIHKSQGMSLDAAEIDLRNAFTYGQGYVALSRVRTLTGMKVLGLNQQALLVDPRVVLRDEGFQEESDEAVSVFGEMPEEEIERMHKSFVTALDGVWEGKEKSGKSERVKKESTLETTKNLLLQGMSAPDIARERRMTLSTIWTHIEKLADSGAIDRAQMDALIPRDISWEEVYALLSKAYDKHGTERLKPVYEEMGEKYDYDTIRLGRICYTLEK